MVLFFPLIAAIPTVIGVSEGIASQRRENAAAATDPSVEKAQLRKFVLECYCEGKGRRAREVDGGRVVLRGGKVWVQPPGSAPASGPSHPFNGFYILYPDASLPPTLGLVSSTSDDPPMLNWIYVDRRTRELRHGNRTQSREHIVGPWGWEAGEEDGAGGLTLGGAEGGVVVRVEGEEGGWQVRWEGEGEGEGVEGGLRVSFERRWVEEGEGEGGGEEGEGEGEGEEEEEGEKGDGGVKKYTETTFELKKTTVNRKKKKPAAAEKEGESSAKKE